VVPDGKAGLIDQPKASAGRCDLRSHILVVVGTERLAVDYAKYSRGRKTEQQLAVFSDAK
jgi:hypothetical protein